MLYRKINRWLAVLCIAVLVLACFGCSENAPKQDTVAADWDECHLYYGLNMDEAELDASAENRLGELIFEYTLTQTEDTSIPFEELLIGGPYVNAVFVKDGVCYTWSFSPNQIVKTVTEGDVSTQTYYEPNSALLTKLNNFY